MLFFGTASQLPTLSFHIFFAAHYGTLKVLRLWFGVGKVFNEGPNTNNSCNQKHTTNANPL